VYRTLIEVLQLKALVDVGEVNLVDCRFALSDPGAGRRAYDAEHLPGAVYADLNQDLSGPVVPGVTGRHPLPSVSAMSQRLGAWGIDSTRQVVVYDDAGGAIAARLWWLLRWLGHEAVAVLDGGVRAWAGAGLPLVASRPAPVRRHFVPRVRADLVVSADDVAELAGRDDWRVLDAREAARYRGDEEPIDPVAGHIEGAFSLPFADNLSEGRFRDPDALAERFEPILGEVPPARCIVYCGSGVTACHDILAAEIAGFEGMRLYPGSWSEWINRRTRRFDA
jgi:thiosulfate/3-mercaptopyruvate sulfurtransferase